LKECLMLNRSKVLIIFALITLLTLLSSLTYGQQNPIPLPGGSTETGRLAASGNVVQRDNALTVRGVDFITDGGLEGGGKNNPFWTQSSTRFGYVICTKTPDDCINAGEINNTVGPRTGTHFAWLGGAFPKNNPLGNETGKLSQKLTINSTGTVALEFYLWIGEYEQGGEDTLTVTLDDTQLISIKEDDSTYHADYTLVSLDISSYADGVERTLTFTGTDIIATNTNFNVDDIAVLINGVTATPTEQGTVPTDQGPQPTETDTPISGLNVLLNGGFEEGLTAWEVRNPSKDKVKCNKPTKSFARSGECAFMFKGVPGERTKLRQTIDMSTLGALSGEELLLVLWVKAANVPDAKAKLLVTYNDSTPRQKVKVDFDQTDEYDRFTGTHTLLSSAVASTRLSVDNKSAFGKFFLDDLRLFYRSAASATNTPSVPTETPVVATETPNAPTDTPDAPTVTVEITQTADVTETQSATPSNTAVPATTTSSATPSDTPIPATSTPTATPSDTSVPATSTPSATPSDTPVAASSTPSATPTNTPVS
jgi:hypothetical protein